MYSINSQRGNKNKSLKVFQCIQMQKIAINITQIVIFIDNSILNIFKQKMKIAIFKATFSICIPFSICNRVIIVFRVFISYMKYVLYSHWCLPLLVYLLFGCDFILPSFSFSFSEIGVVIFEHILWLDVQTEFKSNNYIFKLISEVIADISMYSAVVSVPALSATVFFSLWRVSYFLSKVFTPETS